QCITLLFLCVFFFFSSRRRHTRFKCDWSSDVCSSDLTSNRFNLTRDASVKMCLSGVNNEIPTLQRCVVFDGNGGIGGRNRGAHEIGRASCRERVEVWEVAEAGEKNEEKSSDDEEVSER